MKRVLVISLAAVVLCFIQTSCGGAGSTAQVHTPDPPSDPPAPPPPPPPTYDGIPHIGHVALVVFENQQEDKVLGNPNMPWLTNLALQNAYAANYFADVHPSLGNYFMLTTGQVISNDLGFDGVVTDDNLVRELILGGKTWKAYEETIPMAGYLGDGPLPYVKTHNPAAYFADVRNDSTQANNMVPLTQLQADLAAGTLPEFMFIEPNQINSTHDCPLDHPVCDNDFKLKVGDDWAQQYLGALLSNPTFQQDGLLIVTWDESWDSDSLNGGGHVLTLLVGPKVKTQYVSNTFYQHESTLRLICDAVEIPCMANATIAPAMTEFFNPQ